MTTGETGQSILNFKEVHVGEKRKVKKVEKRRESEGSSVRGKGEGRDHHAESMGGLGHVGSHRADVLCCHRRRS